MDKCRLCGGSSKCPGEIEGYRLPLEGEVVSIPEEDGELPSVWQGLPVKERSYPWEEREEEKILCWIVTHYRRGYVIAVRSRGEDGLRVNLVGSLQAGRVLAHMGEHPRWVGRCMYAFYSL